jgi:hypothetical protein
MRRSHLFAAVTTCLLTLSQANPALAQHCWGFHHVNHASMNRAPHHHHQNAPQHHDGAKPTPTFGVHFHNKTDIKLEIHFVGRKGTFRHLLNSKGNPGDAFDPDPDVHDFYGGERFLVVYDVLMKKIVVSDQITVDKPIRIYIEKDDKSKYSIRQEK